MTRTVLHHRIRLELLFHLSHVYGINKCTLPATIKITIKIKRRCFSIETVPTLCLNSKSFHVEEYKSIFQLSSRLRKFQQFRSFMFLKINFYPFCIFHMISHCLRRFRIYCHPDIIFILPCVTFFQFSKDASSSSILIRATLTSVPPDLLFF